MTRYGKRGDLIVHEEEPFNAETGLAALAENPVTATDAFYVRGHGIFGSHGPLPSRPATSFTRRLLPGSFEGRREARWRSNRTPAQARASRKGADR